MKKIDKALKEVRRLKQKVAKKTRGMTRREVISYFNSTPRPAPRKTHAA